MEKKYSASVDKVYALLIDAKWLEARCLALGELSASCKTRKTPSVQVTMKRRVRRELPAIVAKTGLSYGSVHRIAGGAAR